MAEFSYVPVDTRKECPNCRELNEPENIHCWNCGADFRKTYVSKISPEEQALQDALDHKIDKIGIVIMATSIVTIVGILIYGAIVSGVLRF